MPVDGIVAVAADHQGFAAPLSHDLRPFGLSSTGFGECGQRSNVVHRDAVGSLAELAPARLEPTDQFLVRVDRPGRDAVGENRAFVPLERYAAESGDQWVPARALHAGFEAGSRGRGGWQAWPCAALRSSTPTTDACKRAI